MESHVGNTKAPQAELQQNYRRQAEELARPLAEPGTGHTPATPAPRRQETGSPLSSLDYEPGLHLKTVSQKKRKTMPVLKPGRIMFGLQSEFS